MTAPAIHGPRPSTPWRILPRLRVRMILFIAALTGVLLLLGITGLRVTRG